ncbi:MAG: hypothetical protein WCP98_09155 [Actinomycetes bacterium]
MSAFRGVSHLTDADTRVFGDGGGVARGEAVLDGGEHGRVVVTPLGGGAANDLGMDGAHNRGRG